MENNKQPLLTHWKKLTNPNYIGSEILQPGQELKLTIEKIVKEQVKTADGTQECIVAYFKGATKGMIINKTNAKIITKVLDTPYIDNWIGQSITIYAAKVKAFGELVEALRIKNQKV
tara:strand:+ start:1445 stop:1795 length:351 start_codon:yes stop_codon:yes gene_type:complete